MDWPEVQQICCVSRLRQVNNKDCSFETSYYITTLSKDKITPEQLLRMIRGHWSIENKSHWMRDSILGEDRYTTRKGHGPQNIATMHSLVLFLARRIHTSLTKAIEKTQLNLTDTLHAMIDFH
jgi:predicted transposase YbfD/YdcC